MLIDKRRATPGDPGVSMKDLRIEGGLVLCPRTASSPPMFNRADLQVQEGLITEVSAPHSRDSSPPGEVHIDARGKLIIPGLINCHSHSYGNLVRGLAANLPLELFALQTNVLTVDRTPREQYVSALLGAIEMLKHGVTTVLDQPGQSPYGAGHAAQAYVDTGMRAIVAPILWDRPFHEWLPWDFASLPSIVKEQVKEQEIPSSAEMVQLAEDFLSDWTGRDHRIRPGIAPLAPGRCSDALLEASASLSEAWDAPMHTHLLETNLQAKQARQRYGVPMVKHLDDLGTLNPRFSMGHAVWITDAEEDLLAENGCSVVHNPMSNLTLGSGVFSLARLRKKGINVALGSDGPNCGGNQVLFQHMHLATVLPRVSTMDYAQWPTAADVLDMATAAGGKALCFNDLGSIQVGNRADLVLLRTDNPFFTPLNDPVEQVVHCEPGSSVDTVLVEGEVVVRAGVLTRVDEHAVYEEANGMAETIGSRNEEIRRLANLQADVLSASWAELNSGSYDSSDD